MLILPPLFAAVFVWVLTLGPGTAHAEDDYERLTKTAVEEYNLGHWEEAGALFARAHALQPNARTYWGMGVVAFEARRYADALRHLQRALVDARKPLTEKQRKQAEDVIQRANELVLRIPVQLSPANASVWVDGNPLELDANGVALFDIGRHEVSVRAAGHHDLDRTIDLVAGRSAPLRFDLRPRTSSEDEPSKDAPKEALAQPANLSVESDRSDTSLKVLKWTALSLGVAAATVGVVGFVRRESAANRWNDDEACPVPKIESCREQRDATDRWQKVGIAGVSTAAALGAASVLLFLLDRKPRASTAWWKDACGVQVLGRSVQCRVTF